MQYFTRACAKIAGLESYFDKYFIKASFQTRARTYAHLHTLQMFFLVIKLKIILLGRSISAVTQMLIQNPVSQTKMHAIKNKLNLNARRDYNSPSDARRFAF